MRRSSRNRLMSERSLITLGPVMMRARPMPPEERRAAIVEAALSLLEENGPELTTRMVAEAAGVAEGTIFRVFPTLQDLLAATYVEYLSGERLAARLAGVDPGDSLEEATSAALVALAGYIESVHFALHPPQKPDVKPTAHAVEAKEQFKARFKDLLDWLALTFEPHSPDMTITPQSYAHFLLTLSLGRHMGRPAGLEIPEITEFALNGARRRTTA